MRIPANAPLQKDALRSLLQATASGVQGTDIHKWSTAKRWAKAAQLLNERLLTPEGKLVLMKDPYLEATVTDWLMHFYLSLGDLGLQRPTENSLEWGIWTYFVYEFLPNRATFTLDELSNSISEIFTTETPEKLRKGIQLMLRSYTDSQGIAKCQFLTQESDRFSTGHPDLANPYTVGYLLAKIWERDFGSRTSVLVDDILNAKLGLVSVLGIDKEQLRQQLDILASQRIIEQRSAKPYLSGTKAATKQDTETIYQVIRCWNHATELLEKAYENDAATPNQPLIRSLEGILDDDEDLPIFQIVQEWISYLNPKQAYLLLVSFGSVAA